MQQFVQRFQLSSELGVPKFHYGSHYSSAGVVLHYLLRLEPFTTWSVDLQGGRFDCPDRLFFSIQEAWHSCTHSMSDVKELIPEFYYNYDFLTNTNGFNFGSRQPAIKGEQGIPVNHVELPPWARGSPYEFVRIMRNSLESNYVSNMLNEWIDLIWGHLQRGKKAEKSTNLFFYLTYEGAVDLDTLDDPLHRAATEEQINHFGQTPAQLFIKVHPKRKPLHYEDTFILCPSIDSQQITAQLFTSQIIPPEFIKRKDPPPPMHPGMKVQPHTVGVVSIACVPSSNTGSSANSKMIVVYGNGTIGIHKCKSSKSSSKSSSTVLHKLQWVTPKALPVHGGSLIQWTAASIARDRALKWWMEPREQVFASPTTGPFAGKLLFFGGCWDNQLKYCWLDGSTTRPLNGPFNMPGIVMFCNVVTCMSFAEDGLTLGVGSLDCTCQIWQVSVADRSSADRCTMQPLHVLIGHNGGITGIRLSIKLDIVVSSSVDGLLVIHTLTNGQLLRSISHPSGLRWDNVWFMGILRGEVLGYSKENQHLYLFSVRGDILMSAATEKFQTAEISNNGETLITGGDNGVLTLRTLASSLDVVRTIDLNSSSTVTSISLSRHVVLVGFEDGGLGFVNEKIL